ncbi:MAG: FAD-dependent oxidoreductase [Candidatus Omnitrophota bacterium]
MNIYDLIIIGAGPAGITAAVYAARKKMSFLMLSKDIGGQAAWSGDIENYTGYQFISGPELVHKFEEHMRTYGIEVKEGEEIIDIRSSGGAFTVQAQKSVWQSRSLIICSGKRSRELGVPGEREFRNHGLTYCATCDGPLFPGKDVAVIGGGNSALDAALQMMRIARKVYLVNNTAGLGGDDVMREKVSQSPVVSVINNARVISVQGEKMVSRLVIGHEGKERLLDVQGVFVEIGLIPNSEFIPGIKKNERGEIIVDKHNQTNIPGIFAAGDVTDVPEKQIIIAAGEGSKACLSVFRYLAQQPFS